MLRRPWCSLNPPGPEGLWLARSASPKSASAGPKEPTARRDGLAAECGGCAAGWGGFICERDSFAAGCKGLDEQGLSPSRQGRGLGLSGELLSVRLLRSVGVLLSVGVLRVVGVLLSTGEKRGPCPGEGRGVVGREGRYCGTLAGATPACAGVDCTGEDCMDADC